MEEKHRKYIPLALAGLGGAGLGTILAARLTGLQSIAAMAQVTDSALRLVVFSTAAPIISGGLLASGVIVAAVVIPLIVVTVILKKEKDEDD